MGFRNGAYAKIWEVTPVSDTATKLRMSISRKDKTTGEYEQDFSGFVMAVGSAAASKAAKLNAGDRIKIGDTDVTTKYDKEKKITYTNYKLFSFESADENTGGPAVLKTEAAVDKIIDDAADNETDDDRLPF